MVSKLAAYLPHDRRGALARGAPLPDHTTGSALFADISGFTALTERMVHQFGMRRGAEEVTRSINVVYEALIEAIERHNGSVIGFAGDSITCWFDRSAGATAERAVSAALTMQATIRALPDVGLKVTVASGPVRRFAVGDPHVQLLDVLAGSTVARLATAEGLARRGEILADAASVAGCDSIALSEWRTDTITGESFALVASLLVRPEHSPVAPLDDVAQELLRPWVLPTVYEREQSELGEFLNELRPAVALFLRFRGIDYDGDQQAQNKLDALVRRVQQICQTFDGALLQLTIGDKGSYLYACFGAPTAHEDDDRRAVEAAITLRTVSDTLPFLLPLQIGISRGLMRAGPYGSSSRRTYGALGEEVNIAARLMQAAAPGEVLVSHRIETATRAQFIYEDRPALTAKGVSAPIPIFAVSRQRRSARLHEPVARLPFVGRQNELALITNALEHAQQGRGQVVGIVAEAGLGKSRLAAVGMQLAGERGFTSYAGACEASGTNSAYLVWRAIWQAFFRINPAEPPEQQLQALAAHVIARAPERQQTTPLLAQLLDLPLSDTPFTRALEPKDRRNALESLLEACVIAEARETPLLFVLEDLHWIDPLSHDLLESLSRATAGARVCFLLAYRPMDLARLQAPRVEALPHFTRLALTELTSIHTTELIHAKLVQLFPQHDAPPPERLIAQLSAKAQGNPFYLEELLNYLHDRGIDPWSISSDGHDLLELPASLHTLVLSRIDQLTERQKATLKLASIIGRLFPFAWLHGYYPELGTRSEVIANLDVLARLDLTPLDSGEPELVYLFKHIVTQEAAYESLPYQYRAQLHEQLARYLETLDRVRHLDLLAYHYGRSEHTTKQREYFAAAGEAAQAAYANEVALDFYERLLPLSQELSEQMSIQTRRGSVLELMGRWDAAELAYGAARDLALQSHDQRAQAQALHALGRLSSLRGSYADGHTMLEQARGIWRALDAAEEEARTLIEIGLVSSREGAYDQANQQLSEGLALARAAGQDVLVAAALSAIGLAALDQGNYATGRGSFEEALALQRRIGSRHGIATALNDLGLAAHAQGDLTAARELQTQSLAVRREIGDRQGIAAALINLGDATKEQGDLAAARAMFEEVLALQRDMNYRLGAASALCNLGQIAWLQGNAGEAQEFMERSLAIVREISHRSGIAWVLGYAGEVMAGVGDHAAALAMLEEGLSLGRQLGVSSYVARALCAEGIVLSWQGDLASARERLVEGVALYRELNETPAIAWALSNLGLVTLRLGDQSGAVAMLREAIVLARSAGAKPTILTALATLTGVLAMQQEQAQQAAVLAGAVVQLRNSLGAALDPVRRARFDNAVASLRALLGVEQFDTANAVGQKMALDDVIQIALNSV